MTRADVLMNSMRNIARIAGEREPSLGPAAMVRLNEELERLAPPTIHHVGPVMLDDKPIPLDGLVDCAVVLDRSRL